jgi:O-antigen/teichoic acid export membrane protein
VSLRRAVPAGLVDAGCASLATFAVGLYAARFLPPATLGVYAVFFAAFVMAAIVPTQLLLVPAEIASLDSSGVARLRVLGDSLPLGSLPALAAAVLASGAAVIGTGAPARLVAPLAVTTAVCTFVSPMQDHVRRMLHFAGRSWRAAAVSLVQLAVCVGALALATRLPLTRTWVPFGALALANILSLTAALLLCLEARGSPAPDRLPLARMLRSGRWFLTLRLLPGVANFLSGVLVARLAGAATLGYVEVARVAAQPVIVLATGLSGVLGPRLMESGAARRPDRARPVSRMFQLLVLACGVLYLGWIAAPWPLNPIPRVLPNAYAVVGLLPLMLVAQTVDGLLPAYRAQLMGAGRGRMLVGLEGPACALQCLIAGTAGVTGAFAKPLGLLAQGLVGLGLLRWARDRLYSTVAPAGDR